jgi:hypothetical protein
MVSSKASGKLILKGKNKIPLSCCTFKGELFAVGWLVALS